MDNHESDHRARQTGDMTKRLAAHPSLLARTFSILPPAVTYRSERDTPRNAEEVA